MNTVTRKSQNQTTQACACQELLGDLRWQTCCNARAYKLLVVIIHNLTAEVGVLETSWNGLWRLLLPSLPIRWQDRKPFPSKHQVIMSNWRSQWAVNHLRVDRRTLLLGVRLAPRNSTLSVQRVSALALLSWEFLECRPSSLIPRPQKTCSIRWQIRWRRSLATANKSSGRW